MSKRDPHLAATRIIQDAGGEVVGRTRLQKIAYLSQLAGFGDEFHFEYKHYGPFSEDLARGIDIASAFGGVREEEHRAAWGGLYSTYRVSLTEPPSNTDRSRFLKAAKAIGAVELELAATAAFLFQVEGFGRTKPGNPWVETRSRKPEKARGGHLEQAIAAYNKLRQLSTPAKLPQLPLLEP